MSIYWEFLIKSKNQKFYIFYKNLDWLKIKLVKANLNDFVEVCPHIHNSFDFRTKKNINEFSYYPLFDWINIINYWKIGTSKRRFDLVDDSLNKFGNIIFAIKEYKSNISFIELSWLFFKEYFDYFDKLIDLLCIDRTQNWLVKTVDYCIDLCGIEVFDIIEFLKQEKDYKGMFVEWLSATDLKKIIDKKWLIKYWKQITWLTMKGTYNDLKIYDKILDILDNYMHRKINWVNPHNSYINSDLPITRIELRKKWECFLHIRDNSLNFILDNIEKLFFDYLRYTFNFDFQKVSFLPIESLNWKKIFLAKEVKRKKLFHSILMFKSYWKNIIDLLWQKEFEKFCLQTFPDLQNKDLLQYWDIFELHDFFNN